MPASRSESLTNNETTVNLQPFVLFLVALVAGLLIVIPLLPIWIPNVVYSFSGTAPKVYWYLSRAAGFVALTILWVSMALGLGITNKMARLWPGAPAAFAVHEYVSLLGLAFALYHGLVLMGDHFVDFSLPRLLTPFSIAYETFWVGLGQLGFYAWVLVVLSFYVRKYIGPKVWRAIHYVNFATYLMGLFHGMFSGTDSAATTARWYYLVSVSSLLVLAAYRVYDAKLKQAISGPKPVSRRVKVSGFAKTVASRHVPTIPAGAKKAASTYAHQQAPMPSNPASAESEPLPVPALAEAADGNIAQALPNEQEKALIPVEVATETPVPAPADVTAETFTSPFRQVPTPADISDHVPEPVFYQKKNSPIDPMEAHIQQEPAPTPVLRVQVPASIEHLPTPILRLRIKKAVQAIPVQPPAPDLNATELLLKHRENAISGTN